MEYIHECILIIRGRYGGSNRGFGYSRACAHMVSVTFMNALTGEKADTLWFADKDNLTLATLLGCHARYFFFIFEDTQMTIHHNIIPLQLFVKKPIAFKIYVHDPEFNCMWFLHGFNVDIHSYWGMSSPADFVLRAGISPGKLPFKAFWITYLRSELLNFEGTSKPTWLVQTIEKNIMNVRQVAKRDMLHEMTHDLCVSVFFSLDGNHATMKLKPPFGAVVEEDDSRLKKLMHIEEADA